MNTIKISIRSTGEEQDILVSQLSDQGATGFEQLEDYLLAYFPENNFNSYEIQGLLQGKSFQVETIEEQNWNAIWESNFPPVVVEDFCAVRAGFHEPVPGVEFEIIITPKMSFGTGHHATTYMMMRQMRTLDFRDKEVFDFGTGTGILAILAEKMGAKEVLGIDVDEWSINNAEENAANNHCKHVQFRLTAQLPNKTYDIILANINRNVILDYMEKLKTIIKPGGFILFSGLLVNDGEDIINAAGEEMVLINRQEKDNWLSILFKR